MKELLIKLNACVEAQIWAEGKTWKEIYKTCHRGDWLLWLFKKTNPEDLRRLTLAKGYCAKTAIHLMKDKRSIDAVKASIKFGKGLISESELKTATYAAAAADAAAYTATYAAAAADAAAAYTAAAYAAYAAYAADDDAAAYAAAAYAATADAADREKNQQLTADICRKHLPFKIWNINSTNN